MNEGGDVKRLVTSMFYRPSLVLIKKQGAKWQTLVHVSCQTVSEYVFSQLKATGRLVDNLNLGDGDLYSDH